MSTAHFQQALAARAAAPQTTLHGVFLSILGLGVLLTGPSGVGKSELALDLITRGHALVADDAVEFSRWAAGVVVGTSTPLLAGFMEARGLGILNVERLFGAVAVRAREQLDLIIRLDAHIQTGFTAEERLHGCRSRQNLLGEEIPTVVLTRGLGHNLAPLVETACRDHWLRLVGYAADAAFEKRQMAAITQEQLC